MEIDKNELAENYKSKEDGELLMLYSEGALADVAYEIIETEITKRGLEVPARQKVFEAPLGRPQSLKAHWQGKASLVSAYWLVGVLGGIIFSVLFYALQSSTIVLFVLIVWVPYLIFAMVSIWRCAWNTRWKGWGYIARVIVVLNAIGIIASIISQFQLYNSLQSSRQSEITSFHPSVPPTGKTVLSGTTPDQMSGEISEKLRQFVSLPYSGWADYQIPKDFMKKAFDKAKAIQAFSVMVIWVEEGANVIGSQRADCVRPAKMHVSQSQWDEDSKHYALDEWITIENETFVNMGLWMKTQEQETIEELSSINNSLLPETVLSELIDLEIEHSGILNVEGTPYVFLELETTMHEELGVQIRRQVWIDQESQLIRKSRDGVYENNVLVGEFIFAFVEHGSELSISAPAWLNLDSTNTVVNTSVSVVEHW